MSRHLLTLAAGAICLSLPAMAQSDKGKKEKSWREQVIGSWRIDSLVQVRDGERSSEEEEASGFKPYLRFLPTNKIVVVESKNFTLAEYDLLEGAKGRYLKLDEGMDLNLQIEKVTSKSLVLHYSQPSAQDGDGMFMYLSAASFPLDSVKKRMAAPYYRTDQYALENETNKYPYWLMLESNGEMGSYLGGRKDTGTWKLNPENLNLELKGGQITRKFEILSYAGGSMKLHPLGTPNDSVIELSSIAAPEAIEEYPSDETDEMTMDTSAIMVPEAEGEYDYRSSDQVMLSNSWKAIFAYTDFTEKGDSIRDVIRMNLLEDGTFTFTMGKKTHKGTWRRLPNRNAMVITMKGKEQVAYYEINHTADESYEVEDYTGTGNVQLLISLIPPKAKTAKTYVFVVSK